MNQGFRVYGLTYNQILEMRKYWLMSHDSLPSDEKTKKVKIKLYAPIIETDFGYTLGAYSHCRGAGAHHEIEVEVDS
jgi:hypothetical protein